jgi:tol-pal system protein YbgF
MSVLRLARQLIPVVSLATGACFATRNDVRILQADILALRQEGARADSARARQLEQLAGTLGVVSDSLRDQSVRIIRVQGESRQEFRALGEQMITLQQLVGQSQTIVQRMRGELEQRATQQATLPVQPPPAAGDTTRAPGVPSPAPVNPGPNQLFQEGRQQYQRGSYGAAQTALEDLLRLYPNSDLAPDAAYFLAESYDAGGTPQRADTVFLSVVSRYPQSSRAPMSLYKMALSLARRGRRPDARAAMERVVKEYPSSDEAEFAREWLAANR